MRKRTCQIILLVFMAIQWCAMAQSQEQSNRAEVTNLLRIASHHFEEQDSVPVFTLAVGDTVKISPGSTRSFTETISSSGCGVVTGYNVQRVLPGFMTFTDNGVSLDIIGSKFTIKFDLAVSASASPGFHNIKLTYQFVSGTTFRCSRELTYVVNTDSDVPPTADFTGNPTNGSKPLTVQFTDASTGQITSHSWNFGDGETSVAMNPSHTYLNEGTYTVSLTVTGPGGSNTKTRQNYITIRQPSSLHVSTAGNDADPGTSNAPLRNIQTALNRAGNGDTIKVAEGTYIENLSTAVKVVLLGGYDSNFGEQARGIFNNKTVMKPASGTMLTDAKSSTVDGFVFDGASGANKAMVVTAGHTIITHNIFHRFFQSFAIAVDVPSGVSATIKNNTIANNMLSGGGVINYSLYIRGNANNATVVQNNIVYNNDVGIYIQPSGVQANYNCVFGNRYRNYDGANGVVGANDIAADPQFADAANGDFRLKSGSPCIDAGNPADPVGDEPTPNGGRIDVGAYGGTKNAVPVLVPPVADFTGSPTTGMKPLTARFTDASTGQITSRLWNFGDGQTSAETNPSHTYINAGVYTVSLMVTSAGGSNTKTRANYITVQAPSGGEIKPVVAASQAIGAEFLADITVSAVQNLFGVGFDLTYTNTAFLDVVKPVVKGPFLGGEDELLLVENVDEAAGKVSIGITRKSGNGVDGSGVVVRVKFMSLPSTPSGTQITFALSGLYANDPSGNAINLTPSTATVALSGILVWPGDTNNDKVVNQGDVLPLGLHWSKTGPVRENRSTSWIGQLATPWSPEAATYADANGDGVVNQSDVLSIGLNWGKTHSAPPLVAPTDHLAKDANNSSTANLQCVVIGDTNPGQEFWVEVQAENVTNLFGISFELVYTPTANLDPQSAEPGSLLGPDVIFFPNIDKSLGKISAGVSRKAGQDGVTGTGVIARIKMRMSSNVAIGQATNLSLQNVAANDPAGNAIPFIVSSQNLRTAVAFDRHTGVPSAFALHANSPNPFNPSTRVSYDLPEPTEIKLEIFDMLGKHVRTLVEARQQTGRYSIVWDGRDENGQIVTSGVFIYQLNAGRFVQSRKMILLR